MPIKNSIPTNQHFLFFFLDKTDERGKQDSNQNEAEVEDDEADRNMAATIAAEEVFAVPNEFLANEIVDMAGEVVEDFIGEGFLEVIGDGVADVLGDSVMDILGEFGVVELMVGECLNEVTGNLSGTLAGLTFSAYRCGAYLAPTFRSLTALLLGMAGGLGGSMLMRLIGSQVGGVCGELHDSIGSDMGQMIGSMVFGALGAFAGRYSAIRLSHRLIDSYWAPAKQETSISKSKTKFKAKSKKS